jgi:hypothetical protein
MGQRRESPLAGIARADTPCGGGVMESCESCGQMPLFGQLVHFNDGGPTFYVCQLCADGLEDRGCTTYEIDDPAAPLRLTEWMR